MRRSEASRGELVSGTCMRQHAAPGSCHGGPPGDGEEGGDWRIRRR